MFALKPSSGYNTDTGIIGLSVSIVSAPVSDVQQGTSVNSATRDRGVTGQNQSLGKYIVQTHLMFEPNLAKIIPHL